MCKTACKSEGKSEGNNTNTNITVMSNMDECYRHRHECKDTSIVYMYIYIVKSMTHLRLNAD